MSYQDITSANGVVDVLLEISGAALLGLPLSAPLTKYRVLPELF